MALFYVPVILVIEANAIDNADSIAKSLMDAVVELETQCLVGYTLVTELASSHASDNWAELNQVLENRHVPNSIIEELPS